MSMVNINMQIPKCKYLHIVPKNGGGSFLTNLTGIFSKYPKDCQIEKHIFITSDRGFYENHAVECKVYYFDMEEVDMINHFSDNAEYIFVHGFYVSWRRILQIRTKHLSKIIWRTWGADMKTPDYYNVNAINRLYLNLCYKLFVKRVRHFKLIGAANLVDEIKIKKMFGNGLELRRIPYTDTEKSNTLYEKIADIPNDHKKIRVMVGHSGYPDDHHIELLEKMKKFDDENIVYSLIMSYGNSEYIKKVKEYTEQRFGKNSPKIEWISEKMEFEQYLKYLNSNDVILFDMINSAALGNLAPIVYFDKKIYLNRKGDIAAAFEAAGLKCGYCDEIEKQSFYDFSLPILNTSKSKSELFVFQKDYSRLQWKNLLDELK